MHWNELDKPLHLSATELNPPGGRGDVVDKCRGVQRIQTQYKKIFAYICSSVIVEV